MDTCPCLSISYVWLAQDRTTVYGPWNFACSLGFSPRLLLLFSNHTMSPGENKRGSSWSSCRTALCCSLSTSWATPRRSTNSLQYSCWGVISAGGGCNCSWSGNRNSRPNIIRLAVSPVTEWGVPRNALIICGSSKSHSSCPLRSNKVLSESPKLRFPLSTMPLDCGWYGVVWVLSTFHRIQSSSIS